MRFEWDEKKREANLAKHGVDFPTAAKALRNRAMVERDVRKEYGEPRWLGYGEFDGRLYVVVFTVRGDRIRIISARKANAREAKKHGRAQ